MSLIESMAGSGGVEWPSSLLQLRNHDCSAERDLHIIIPAQLNAQWGQVVGFNEVHVRSSSVIVGQRQ